ncbi:hypothetical protein MTBPR1_70110 [Candidatus Terasakiella magnetica]|uniref:Uncharacterized protein n=1 Tax=Candidatus Terasakiella magnetica TaxID=1867952 RepID=A0A1C3RKR0_9PROT|nr:hypothetical protein [Candidatus Terasakiella magnetica]SCA57838.1 hypothetical protein MTBPR1_70110 [Candidatus Terasakiella magnetica]
MAIPSIDNLSAALYVPSATAAPKSQPKALAQRQPFETQIAPSRSKALSQIARVKGAVIQSLVKGLDALVKQADKTTLPNSFPETSRVNLQAEITTILGNIERLVNSAEVGSVSLLRTEERTIKLQSSEYGGKIEVKGVAIDAQALGLSNINVLSELGIKDASRRVENALYVVNERVNRLEQLDKALRNEIDFGSLTNVSNNASLATNVASNYASSGSYNPPVQYQTQSSGQYNARFFERGSFVDLQG